MKFRDPLEDLILKAGLALGMVVWGLARLLSLLLEAIAAEFGWVIW